MAKRTSIYNEQKNFVSSIGYFIMFLMVGLIPHIYKYTVFSLAESESIYFKNEAYVDLYMLAKSRMFLVLIALLLCVFMYQVAKKHIVFIKDKITIGTGVFALVVILSSLVSEYQDLVYWGAKDRFEGMWVWLAYLVVFTVARHYGSDKTFVDRLLKVFMFSASIMAAFGIMQVLGYDIYTEGPLRWFAFPKHIAENIGAYMTSNNTNELAVGAMYNSNYFGVYMGLAALVSGFAFVSEQSQKQFIYFALLLMNYAAMIASKSEAALLGFALSVAVFTIANAKTLWSDKRKLLLLVSGIIVVDRLTVYSLIGGQSSNAKLIYVLVFLCIGVGVVLYKITRQSENIRQVFYKRSIVIATILLMLGTAVFNYSISIVGDHGSEFSIKEVSLEDKMLDIEFYNQTKVKALFTESGIRVEDALTGEEINVPLDNSVVGLTINDQDYNFKAKSSGSGYKFSMKTPTALDFYYNGSEIQYFTTTGTVYDIKKQERQSYFYEHGSAYTNRSYIWSHALPKLMEKPVLGYGIETFIDIFPQDDYIGKVNFYYNGRSLLIDKSHSMFMGIGLGMGGIALAIFILLIIALLSDLLKTIGFEVMSSEKLLLYSGCVLLLVAGIFNDSTIPITLMLTSFSGMGLGINGESN